MRIDGRVIGGAGLIRIGLVMTTQLEAGPIGGIDATRRERRAGQCKTKALQQQRRDEEAGGQPPPPLPCLRPPDHRNPHIPQPA